MAEDSAGATGNSPASTGATGNSPSPSTGATGSSPSTTAHAASGTTKKIDYGMGARRPETQPTVAEPLEMTDDQLFEKYGDRIFKHERFKELSGYKQKFEQVAPYQEFVDKNGGLESVQGFYQHLGPLWEKFISMGPQAQVVWSKLLPVFQAILADQPIDSYFGQQRQVVEEEVEIDPFEERVKPLQGEIGELKSRLQKHDEDLQKQLNDQKQARQQENIKQYVNILDQKIEKSGGDIPASLRQMIAETMYNRLMNYMPKMRGQAISPLDMYNAEAFEQCWTKEIEPMIKEARGSFLSKAKNTIDNGGPALPNTNAYGQTGTGTKVPMSQAEKSARLRQVMTGSV